MPYPYPHIHPHVPLMWTCIRWPSFLLNFPCLVVPCRLVDFVGIPGQKAMATKLVDLLNTKGLELSSANQVNKLQQKLALGHQTDGEDHDLIGKLLGLKLVIHHASCCETMGSEDGPEMHFAHSSRADGSGHAEMHFDFLSPKFLADQPSTHPLQDLLSVSHAITLKGPDLIASVLDTFKDVENRNFSMQGQWHCIHQGKSSASKEMQDHLHKLIPNLETKRFKAGYIHGMVFIEKSESLREYRERVGCGDMCSFTKEFCSHHTGCIASPFVLGPVLNYIRYTVIFRDGIPASGALGKWPLSSATKKKVDDPLHAGHYTLKTAHQFVCLLVCLFVCFKKRAVMQYA